jgi:carbon-monoxide dehydrogenase medium subunit
MYFTYLEPGTIEEAISSLTKYEGKAKVIAGGTDLLVQIRGNVLKPEYLVDIEYIPGLDYIKYDEKQGLSIGALTTIRTLERSTELQKKYPVISQAAHQMASVAIRNVGTLGGNLCNAAPSADTAPSLIGLEAKAKLIGPDGERMIALEDFFTGPGESVLKPGELLVEIQVPPVPGSSKSVYLKHSIRGSIDLAIVGVAATVTMDGERCQDVRIVLGAVAPTPMKAKEAEKVLKDKKIDDDLIERASQAVLNECRPITDVRASAEYRREMVRVFTRRALKEAIAK